MPTSVPPTNPPPAAAVEAPVQAAAGSETPNQAEAPTTAADDATRSACEKNVAIIVGQQQGTAAVDDPALKELAAEHPDLVTCGAVWRDSAQICALLPTGRVSDCREQQAVFHELRTYPGKRTYLFTDEDWQRCRTVPALVTACDAIRAALRAGDAAACLTAGGAEPLCRAYVTLDRSQCDVTGELADVQVSMPPANVKDYEPSTVKVKEAAVAECRLKIERRTALDQGLEKLAAAGPQPERDLAKAALHQDDACKSVRDAARQWCGEHHGPPPAGALPPDASPGVTVPAPPQASPPAPGKDGAVG